MRNKTSIIRGEYRRQFDRRPSRRQTTQTTLTTHIVNKLKGAKDTDCGVKYDVILQVMMMIIILMAVET